MLDKIISFVLGSIAFMYCRTCRRETMHEEDGNSWKCSEH